MSGISKVRETSEALINETGKIIIGKRKQLELIMTAIICGGHVLLEDLPGSGKTTLVRTLAIALGCDRKRIQFTPDLLPSDVVGTTIFNQATGSFETRLGPVSTNLLLADEINRAIPRTQAALLEAMEERQVTIDGKTFLLPDPFFVMATQNPIEKESTFPLPAAQLDRFFIKLSLGYPDKAEELAMLDRVGDVIPFDSVRAVTDPSGIAGMREAVKAVRMSEPVKDYIVRVVQKTRSDANFRTGASPRASRCLYQGSKALAAIRGRDYVIPEDVQDLFLPVVSHRTDLSTQATYRGADKNSILRALIESEPVPPEKEKML
ncbi:MAG: MoxR family ATPase [Spirochaetales bacterium]|nr:MoxR family ATPase [Spirochaetales bacterium]MBR4477307.1 MoxR family ATPase [Spirochaetales bacterium]